MRKRERVRRRRQKKRLLPGRSKLYLADNIRRTVQFWKSAFFGATDGINPLLVLHVKITTTQQVLVPSSKNLLLLLNRDVSCF